MNAQSICITTLVIVLLIIPVAVFAKHRNDRNAMYCKTCGVGLSCCVKCQASLCDCHRCDCKFPSHLDPERMARIRIEKPNPPSTEDYLCLDKQAVIRILPAPPLRIFSVYNQTGKCGNLFSRSRLHYINDRYVQCSETECPICEYYKSLWDTVNQIRDWNKREEVLRDARGLKAIQRFRYNVLDRRSRTVKIWSVGPTVQKQLEELMKQDDLTDVDEGHDLVVTRRSVAGIFQYDVQPMSPSPLAENVEAMERIVANQYDLDQAFRNWFMSNDELRKEIIKFKLRRQPICEGCLQPFPMQFPGQKYCSPDCWLKATDPVDVDAIERLMRTCGHPHWRAIACRE